MGSRGWLLPGSWLQLSISTTELVLASVGSAASAVEPLSISTELAFALLHLRPRCAVATTTELVSAGLGFICIRGCVAVDLHRTGVGAGAAFSGHDWATLLPELASVSVLSS